jgi:hypothetical protein|tara:strand:+ start:30768 stop:30986 length:219 start_codon:yes stop_codon:yes gene_type:complete
MLKSSLLLLLLPTCILFAQQENDIISEINEAAEELDLFSYIGSWEEEDWLLLLDVENNLSMNDSEKENDSGT